MDSQDLRNVYEFYNNLYEQKIGVPLKDASDRSAREQLQKMIPKGEKVHTPKSTLQNAAYEPDMFDIILEYLVAEGYADTNDAAIAIMANMSEEWKQSIVEGGFGLGFLDLRKPAPKPKAEPTSKPPTVSSSGGAGGEVTVDKQYPATLRGKGGVKSTDSQGTEYFMPYQSQGALSKPNTLPDLNKAQYKNTYTNTYKDIPASQSTKNPQSNISRTGIPKVRSATRTYGID